ncbi:MAG: tail fiber domain-containing protein [Planctomycetes bacterium]|nr:tail fiber domain-containing protein [Planctomycetota bacterium]
MTVTNGIYNIDVGGGVITAGSQATLSACFGNVSTVYMEIQVGAETLTPRSRVYSSGYALNADRLDGLDSTAFAPANGGAGYLQLTPVSAQSDATANPSIFVNKTSGSGNLVTLQKVGVDKLTISNAANTLTFGDSAGGADKLIIAQLNSLNLEVDTGVRVMLDRDNNSTTALFAVRANNVAADLLTVSETGNTTILNQSELRLGELTVNGTDYVAMRAAASMAAPVTYTWPGADGTSGQVLSTNGAGTLSWTTAASGITSLNGLTGATQTFTNDSNVTISSSGTTHTLGWSGMLPVARGGTELGTTPTNGQLLIGNGTNHTLSTLAEASAFEGLLDAADVTADRTWTLPDASGTISLGGATGFATPALTLGTANAAGSATTVMRSDATILAFDATNPAALGVAGPGSATVAARRDHVHPAIDLSTGAGTTYSGILPVGNGGTGMTSYTTGDMLFASNATTLSTLAAGASGLVLTSNGAGAAPSWQAAGSSASVGATYITQTADATLTAEQALSSLATGYMKVTTGTGVVSSQAAPIPVAEGGTGATTAFTTGSVVFAGASGVSSQDNANLFWDDTNNRLGLGTVTPAVGLHVVGNAKIQGTTAADSAGLLTIGNGSAGWQAKTYYYAGYDFGVVDPGGTTRLHISNTGNVGIGGVNVNRPLVVSAGTNGSGETQVLQVKHAGGSAGDNVAMEFAPAGLPTPAKITGIGSGSNHVLLSFTTVNAGTAAEAMRIDNAGNAGIGLTSMSYKLQLSTDSAAKPSTNTWTVASDRRLKEDIRPFEDGAETLMGINPVWYRYNGKAGTPTDTENIGIVAQEVREAAPYTIRNYRARMDPTDAEETDLLGFNSHALTFVLINAAKEHERRIAALEAENAALRAEIEAGRTRMEERLRRLEEKSDGAHPDGASRNTRFTFR